MPVQQPTVLILASGHGERFAASGGEGAKLHALLHGKEVLQHTLDAVRASGLPFHLESGPHPGMGDTIAAALRATLHAPGWLILPADLPLIRPDTLIAVADALALHEVVLPMYAGQRGHPVGFTAACREQLLALHGEHGAASVVRSRRALELIVTDAGSVSDIDTLADLRQAELLLANRPWHV